MLFIHYLQYFLLKNPKQSIHWSLEAGTTPQLSTSEASCVYRCICTASARKHLGLLGELQGETAARGDSCLEIQRTANTVCLLEFLQLPKGKNTLMSFYGYVNQWKVCACQLQDICFGHQVSQTCWFCFKFQLSQDEAHNLPLLPHFGYPWGGSAWKELFK